MVLIDYKIVNNDYDDFSGENGFLLLIINDFKYGEIYSDELNNVIDNVSLYNWFERLLKVFNLLYINNEVYLSDVDSYNVWIYFRKQKHFLTIELVSSEKESNTKDIESSLNTYSVISNKSQTVKWTEFSTELLAKAQKYIYDLYKNNNDDTLFRNLIALYDTAISYSTTENKQ